MSLRKSFVPPLPPCDSFVAAGNDDPEYYNYNSRTDEKEEEVSQDLQGYESEEFRDANCLADEGWGTFHICLLAIEESGD